MARLPPLLPTPPASARSLLLPLLSDAASASPRCPLTRFSSLAPAQATGRRRRRRTQRAQAATHGSLHRHVSLYSDSRRQEPNPPPSSRNRSQEPPSKDLPRSRSPSSTSITASSQKLHQLQWSRDLILQSRGMSRSWVMDAKAQTDHKHVEVPIEKVGDEENLDSGKAEASSLKGFKAVSKQNELAEEVNFLSELEAVRQDGDYQLAQVQSLDGWHS